MSRVLRVLYPLLGMIVSLVVVFAAVTYLALEGQEVAVLRTRAPDGRLRETRVWVADQGGATWIEAGNTERDFYADLLREPQVDLERDGVAAPYRATSLPGSEGHDAIRAALRAKYGAADWWVGKLVDTSRSVAIRLEPESEATAPGGVHSN